MEKIKVRTRRLFFRYYKPGAIVAAEIVGVCLYRFSGDNPLFLIPPVLIIPALGILLLKSS